MKRRAVHTDPRAFSLCYVITAFCHSRPISHCEQISADGAPTKLSTLAGCQLVKGKMSLFFFQFHHHQSFLLIPKCGKSLKLYLYINFYAILGKIEHIQMQR